jgi:fermentation-respiration switch protein FrsA (DUF1100 family)
MLILAAAAVAIYLVALIGLIVEQRGLLYLNHGADASPASAGLPAFTVRHVRTADGETLLAWYAPPAPGRPLILYFHGNADPLSQRAARFQRLTATGDGLLAIAYRGYPGSTGSPTEEGLHLDGEAAWREALALGFEPKNIVILGESLGSGVAVALASSHTAGALVLDSAFLSAVDVAAGRYWYFPVRLLMLDQFRSDLLIGNVHTPLLMAHGSADTVTPLGSGEKLFALANEPKKFIRIDGADHLALGAIVPQALDWIDAALAGRPNSIEAAK